MTKVSGLVSGLRMGTGMHKIERDKKRRVYLVYRGVTVIGHARTMDCAQSMVDHDLMMMDKGKDR